MDKGRPRLLNACGEWAEKGIKKALVNSVILSALVAVTTPEHLPRRTALDTYSSHNLRARGVWPQAMGNVYKLGQKREAGCHGLVTAGSLSTEQ